MQQALSSWNGEFSDRRREARFRETQGEVELRQLRLLWSVALLCFLAFWPLDLVTADNTRDASIARAVILATGGAVLLLSLAPLSRRSRDSVACLGLLLAMAVYGHLLHARGEGPGALLLLVLGSYLFSPGGFAGHCLCGWLGSALAWMLAGAALKPADAAYLLPANLLAMLALAQLNRGRRRLYSEGLRLMKMQRTLARLHRQNTALLHNALPEDIARQLRSQPGRRPARLVPFATVIYADLVGFSTTARTLAPAQLIALLDKLFSRFDAVCSEHGVQKIKTLGDGYLAAAGLRQNAASADADADAAVAVALGLQRAVVGLAQESGLEMSLRVGLHGGSVVAGVLGKTRFAFDIWGDTVNVACRLQGRATPGTVLVSASVVKDCRSPAAFGEPKVYSLRGCGSVVASELQVADEAAKLTITAEATPSGATPSQSMV
ncbi:MAG: adenylate/guanylate cyclase domain-containing protein [Pseudomonadota bacterium]